jgi:DNA-binding NtrC family response regulator
VERAIVLATGPVLPPELFPPHVRGLAPVRIGRTRPGGLEGLCRELVTQGITEARDVEGVLYERVVSLVEKELITQTLKTCQGVQTKTATRLGINRNTLHKKIEDFGLQDQAR